MRDNNFLSYVSSKHEFLCEFFFLISESQSHFSYLLHFFWLGSNFVLTLSFRTNSCAGKNILNDDPSTKTYLQNENTWIIELAKKKDTLLAFVGKCRKNIVFVKCEWEH